MSQMNLNKMTPPNSRQWIMSPSHGPGNEQNNAPQQRARKYVTDITQISEVGSLFSYACGQWRHMTMDKNDTPREEAQMATWKPRPERHGHSIPLAKAATHGTRQKRPLAATCGHSRKAATRGHSSGCKWLFFRISNTARFATPVELSMLPADLCVWMPSKAIMQAVPCSPEALKDVALCPNLGMCSWIKIASITVPGPKLRNLYERKFDSLFILYLGILRACQLP